MSNKKSYLTENQIALIHSIIQMLPKRCHFAISSLKNGSVKPFVGATALFPLNSRRRLRRNIINDPVNILNLIYNPYGNLLQHIIRNPREIRGHEIAGVPSLLTTKAMYGC